ncbi:hypothetical protein MMC25_007959 [Agyrium rufum]|nr:hypothetical protein [Agyrium rufum]
MELSPNLQSLPNEVIFQIISYLTHADAFSFLSASRKFYALADNPFWRHSCRTEYQHWKRSWNFAGRLKEAGNLHDWKTIFRTRHRKDRSAKSNLESILAQQSGRLQLATHIIDEEYDVKDLLLSQLDTSEGAVDVLARRYQSREVLNSIYRRIALQNWTELILKHDEDTAYTLEKALAGLDMFAGFEETADAGEISDILDSIAREYKSVNPAWVLQSSRQRALSLAHFLRLRGYREVEHSSLCHNLENNFIGRALIDPHHPCLSLTLAAIYAAIGNRIGIDARPCCFPRHIYVVIRAPPDLDLDGHATLGSSVDEAERMFMDPYNSPDEIEETELRRQLAAMGVKQDRCENFLRPAKAVELLFRASLNIKHSAQIISRHIGGHPPSNIRNSLYGAFWASLLLSQLVGNPNTMVYPIDRDDHIMMIRRLIYEHFEPDLFTYRHFLSSLLVSANGSSNSEVRQAILADELPRTPKLRGLEKTTKVRYSIGQIFRHKRYGYVAAIIGWDSECKENEAWINQMRIRELPNGRHQSFYNSMSDAGRIYYVAEENVQIILPTVPPPNLLQEAGRYFKRWDIVRHKFISNMHDEYPDD